MNGLWIKRAIASVVVLGFSSWVNAGVYLGLSPYVSQIQIEGEKFSPIGAELKLGYEFKVRHSLEIGYVSGMKEDELNRLSVEVPSVATATYRYNLYPAKKLKSYFVLGASQIELKAIYDEASDATPDLEESYSGFVYGFAFEEALDSVPSLKVMGQWVNLYDGEALNIHGLSLGMRYDF